MYICRALWIVFGTAYAVLSNLYGQIHFDNILPEAGLSQSTVGCLLQDRYGFVWIGTQDGLNRYDGYRFLIYKSRKGDSASLADNSINALLEDAGGRLWIGTSRGLSEYQRETNTFVNHHSVPGSSDELVDPNVTSLAEDSMYLWIGTENGLSRMKKSDGSFTSYGQRIGLTDLYISDVMVDRSGSVWIGTISGGLHQYNPETGQMKNFRFDGTESKQKSAERVFDTYQDREQNIWVSTSAGIVLLEPSSGSFGRFLHRSRIYEVSQDSRGFYWAAAREGLYRFTDPKEIEHFEHSPIEPRSLTATTVNCIVEDEAGLLWFGTQYGLSIYDPLKERFGPIAPSGKGLPIKDAWCMYEDRTGFVWIGSYNQGLVRFDMKKHRFDHLQSRPDQNWTLSSNLVRTVIEDEKNQIWVGMWGGGLNRVDPVTLNVSRSPLPEFSDKNVLALLSDGERIWIGSDGGGLYNYNLSTKKLSLPYGHGLTDAGVTCLTKDDKGILWVGTRRGLNRVDLATGRISQFSTDLTGPRNISNDYILCVTLDRDGRAWIGTDKGLNCFDPKAETIRAFYESDGLPNETVYGVIEDNHGDLWITTNRGLVRCTFKPEDNKPTFRVYDVSDGLQSNEFNQASYLRTSAGKILVGGIHGINVFHPDSIRDSDRWPPLRFTDFKILNETVDIDHHLDKSITLADQINLYPGDNIFSLEFAALDLINPARITYAYRLRGFQKNWTLVDADRRVATYTNLDPGRYLFEVKCTNRDGKWNEMPVSMIVNIIPPFWKTWWFRTCILILLGAFLIGGHQIRVRSIKKRNDRLEELIRLRTEEIQRGTKELQMALDDLRKTQTQLVQSEKMAALGQMVAGVAHEINNPLTFIEPNLQYVQQELQRLLNDLNISNRERIERSVEQTHQAMTAALNGCQRIKTIIANLKGFAQPGSEGLIKTELNMTLNVVIDLFAYQYPEVPVEKQFGEPVLIHCYGSELNLAIMDIMDNAALALKDAIDQGMRQPNEVWIKVKTETATNQVRVSIEDNGVGIPEDVQKSIFDPFFTTRTVGAGRGLGLSEVYGIVRKHEGEITFTSRSGVGSRFDITLPVLNKS